MSNFRVNKPLSEKGLKQDIELQYFSKGAEQHEVQSLELNKKEKAQRSFTIPLNDYELALLRQVAKKDDRSQRYMARMLLVKALKEHLD